MAEAGKQFRRVNGHLHLYLPKLRAALDADIAGTVETTVQDEDVCRSLTHTGRRRSSTELGTTSSPAAGGESVIEDANGENFPGMLRARPGEVRPGSCRATDCRRMRV
jgi:hypothetical protein